MVYAATLARTGLGNIATYCRLQTSLFAPLIKPVFRHTWEFPPVYKHDALLSIENSTQQDPRRHRSSVRASARRNVISKALRLFAVMNLLLLSLLSCAAVAEGADAPNQPSPLPSIPACRARRCWGRASCGRP